VEEVEVEEEVEKEVEEEKESDRESKLTAPKDLTPPQISQNYTISH